MLNNISSSVKKVHLSPTEKRQMIDKVVRDGEEVSKICQRFGVSRTLFYRLKKRYELKSLTPKALYEKRYWHQIPEKYEKMVLDLVSQHPGYGIRTLVNCLPKIFGKPFISHHGVQNILRRHHLSLEAQREVYVLRRKESFLSSLFTRWKKG